MVLVEHQQLNIISSVSCHLSTISLSKQPETSGCIFNTGHTLCCSHTHHNRTNRLPVTVGTAMPYG